VSSTIFYEGERTMKKRFALSVAVIAIIAALCLITTCKYNNPDAVEVTADNPENPDYTSKYPLLIINKWSGGSFTLQKQEEWFEFTATAVTQFVHFKIGTLTNVSVQLYNKKNETVDTRKELYNNSYTSFPVTLGQVYYIKVTPSGTKTGTYQIGFTESVLSPDIIASMDAANQLTINKWSDGSFTLQENERWFKFTATAAAQYVHFKIGTLNDVYIQLYNLSGTVDTRKELYNNSYTSFAVAIGQVYYIKVTPPGTRTGTYQIGFTSSTASPDMIELANAAVQLNINEWSDGSFTLLEKEKWFKFTATAATQYIHLKKDTVNDVYVQLYNNSYIASDTQKELYGSGSSLYTSSPVTVGQLYYIKVTPYGNQTGNYKIGITGSAASPDTMAAMNAAVQLSINTWASGNISLEVKEQWFKFTATAATHYIHFQKGGLDDVYVLLFNSSGVAVDTQKELYGSGSNLYTSSPVTVGQTYYIRVTPYGSKTGNYKIGFNTSATAPAP